MLFSADLIGAVQRREINHVQLNHGETVEPVLNTKIYISICNNTKLYLFSFEYVTSGSSVVNNDISFSSWKFTACPGKIYLCNWTITLQEQDTFQTFKWWTGIVRCPVKGQCAAIAAVKYWMGQLIIRVIYVYTLKITNIALRIVQVWVYGV